MKIISIEHVRNGEIIWEQNNIHNLFHTEGQEFCLTGLFIDSSIIPTNYYLGLDNRTTVAEGDSMADLIDEPDSNGYVRQTLSSTTGWTLELNSDEVNTVKGNIISFNASGGDWGPVTQLFLTDQSDDSGYLIATASLQASRTVENGDTINMRMVLALQDKAL